MSEQLKTNLDGLDAASAVVEQIIQGHEVSISAMSTRSRTVKTAADQSIDRANEVKREHLRWCRETKQYLGKQRKRLTRLAQRFRRGFGEVSAISRAMSRYEDYQAALATDPPPPFRKRWWIRIKLACWRLKWGIRD